MVHYRRHSVTLLEETTISSFVRCPEMLATAIRDILSKRTFVNQNILDFTDQYKILRMEITVSTTLSALTGSIFVYKLIIPHITLPHLLANKET